MDSKIRINELDLEVRKLWEEKGNMKRVIDDQDERLKDHEDLLKETDVFLKKMRRRVNIFKKKSVEGKGTQNNRGFKYYGVRNTHKR